jgi:hypothetical protein
MIPNEHFKHRFLENGEFSRSRNLRKVNCIQKSFARVILYVEVCLVLDQAGWAKIEASVLTPLS